MNKNKSKRKHRIGTVIIINWGGGLSRCIDMFQFFTDALYLLLKSNYSVDLAFCFKSIYSIFAVRQ